MMYTLLGNYFYIETVAWSFMDKEQVQYKGTFR